MKSIKISALILFTYLFVCPMIAKAQVSFLLNATLATYPTDGQVGDTDGVSFGTLRVSRAVAPGLGNAVEATVDSATFSIPYDPSNPFTYQARLDWSIAAFDGCTEFNTITASADWHQQDFFFGMPLDAYISTTVSCQGASCHCGVNQFWYGANLVKDPPVMYGIFLC